MREARILAVFSLSSGKCRSIISHTHISRRKELVPGGRRRVFLLFGLTF
jgi:hypothetical protein